MAPKARKTKNDGKKVHKTATTTAPKFDVQFSYGPKMLTPSTVDQDIINFLKDDTADRLPQERYVILAFEDYPLLEVAPSWNSSKVKDQVPPYFVILSIRHINSPLYQPIACIHWNRTQKDLAIFIKVYIVALSQIAGLTVVATVCPPAPHFIPVVMNLLNLETLEENEEALVYSVIPSLEVVHLFDPPYLLKELRNMFIETDKIQFLKNNNIQYAGWKQICDCLPAFSDLDESSKSIVNVTQENKNITSLAAKTFSFTIVKRLYTLLYSVPSNGSAFITGTAEFCLSINDLFDSLNSIDPDELSHHTPEEDSAIYNDAAKLVRKPKFLKYRLPYTKKSFHAAFWNEILGVLRNAYCIKYLTPQDTTKNSELKNDGKDVLPGEEEILNLFLSKCKTDASHKSPKDPDCSLNSKQITQLLMKNRVVVEQTLERNRESLGELASAPLEFHTAAISELIKQKKLKFCETDLQELARLQEYEHVDIVQADCIRYWMNTVAGMQKICEYLTSKRFKVIHTKNFNVDCIHQFIWDIKMYKGINNAVRTHEYHTYTCMNKQLAYRCFEPNVCFII